MKARYYVSRVMDGWAVWDRRFLRRILPGDETPPVFQSRNAARARARELNTKDRRAETKEEARHGI